MAAAAAGGQDTIGLRCPAHPVAQALLDGLRARTRRAPAWPRPAPTASAASARPRRAHVRRRVRRRRCWCSTAGRARSASSRPSSTARAAAPVLLRPGVLTRAEHRGGRRRAAAPSRDAGGAARLGHAGGALRAARHAAPDGRPTRCRPALDVLAAPTPRSAAVYSRTLPRAAAGPAARLAAHARRRGARGAPAVRRAARVRRDRRAPDLGRDAARRARTGTACATGCSAPPQRPESGTGRRATAPPSPIGRPPPCFLTETR